MIKGWLNLNAVNQPDLLLRQYKETGDNTYLTLLVKEFNLALFHYLVTLSDKDLAEDILQICWIKVMKSAHLYTQGTQVKSWLFTIARHALIDELRKQKRWQCQTLDEVQIETRSPSPEQSMGNTEQQTIFNNALANLPFHQREAFIFQKEGFSLNEICQLTGESFETVKTRIRYAKNKLKKSMEQSNAS